jgi:hypothetical protein
MLAGGGCGVNGTGGVRGRASISTGTSWDCAEGRKEKNDESGEQGVVDVVAMDKLGVRGGVEGGVISPIIVGKRSGVIDCWYLTTMVGRETSLIHPSMPVGMILVMRSRSLCSSHSLAQAARLM